ncbi:prostaglandin reductase-3-like [Amphiura filiformis]|uniref:prostaglandin reductase-3-like n=1 Tax=Amphiura filiformis TaxID=82378 RepID=UPI003B210AD1
MAARLLPKTFRRLMVTRLSPNFREAVEMQTAPMEEPGPSEVLVKTRYVGINASDINHSTGRYNPTQKPPFGAGLEGIGEIVGIGKDVKSLRVGQGVMYMKFGAFSEYSVLPATHAMPVPDIRPEFLSLLVSGMTADLSLREVGRMKEGETVLITAAAGGTGQFAVQLAKLAGCHVIGTCSTQSKVEFLKSIGCDRPVNYTQEKLADVLRKEYPKGIDVVYETVGGEMFETCVKALANRGRLIVIGYISGYQSDVGFNPSGFGSTLAPRLLQKSASVCGFLMFHYADKYGESLTRLGTLMASGALKVQVDNGKNHTKRQLKGLEEIFDGVDYLYSRKSEGKIYIDLSPSPHPAATAAKL